jgi:hypothetical protein
MFIHCFYKPPNIPTRYLKSYEKIFKQLDVLLENSIIDVADEVEII